MPYQSIIEECRVRLNNLGWSLIVSDQPRSHRFCVWKPCESSHYFHKVEELTKFTRKLEAESRLFPS